MFDDDTLKDHLSTAATVRSSALVLAEWNMNDADNLAAIGNYRFRPREATYNSLNSIWDARDAGNWWTNATDADVEVFGPYDESDEPIIFTQVNERMKRLYSLDDCIKPHRPRSGINYIRMLGDGYSGTAKKYFAGIGKNIQTGVNNSSVNRPRYYLADVNNSFKYWSSWRTESGVERGISKTISGKHFIDDSVPFVVYKQSVPTNKLVVKMQTNIGTENLGTVSTPDGPLDDPFYGAANATTPRQWDIEVLKGGLWTRIKRFNQNDTRTDGSPIVPADGYVELVYGVVIPPQYEGPFDFKETLASDSLLPRYAAHGDYYLVVTDEGAKGTVHLWYNNEWVVLTNPDYGWKLNENFDASDNSVSDFVSPGSWTEFGATKYREFEYIDGIRLVAYTMNRSDASFDLIEMSPRLVSNVTDRTVSFKTTKSIGGVDATALPVGGLEAGTGEIEIFDYDYAFSDTNTNSIIHNFLDANITFSFYDVTKVDNVKYHVPLKTLHSQSAEPEYSETCTVKFTLRDSFYIFENEPAPSIMVKNVSLSYAVSTLLDSIGFTNYVFVNKAGAAEPIIPYFFVAPDQNTAEVLQKLALATQSAMYFDEYNNFVVAYREYVFSTTRAVDYVLDGDSANIDGQTQPNIADISSTEKKTYNGGTVNYTERYVQRSIGSLTQANFVNADQSWIYLPSLLWEVSGGDATRTVNDKASQQSAFSLAAMPLNSDLSSTLPYVNNSRKLVANSIDVGDNVYWLPRYKGYLYANGEIIKYDAVRFIVQGQPAPVWISSNEEYQKYFSVLPFNGKMYPDGFIRIYAEPRYESVDGETYLKIGSVAKHGRAQFGTTIATHPAGVSEYWLSNTNVRGIRQASEYLFTTAEPPATVMGPAGYSAEYNSKAGTSTRTGIIKNFLRDKTYTDAQINEYTTDRSGLIQASALAFTGPNNFRFADNTEDDSRDWISYVHKQLDNDFKHFGTRMRIIGKIEAASEVDQSPTGSTIYYNFNNGGAAFVLNGGSGGIGIGVNPSTNTGYFLELMALTNTNVEDLASDDNVGSHNIVFYKNVANASGGKSVPIKLWGGLAEVLVDLGTFVGAQRSADDEKTTVYDISLEYEDFASFRRFYIYVNDMQVATVDDDRPIRMYNSMCLFIRGASKAMFENIWALRQSISKDSSGQVVSSAAVNKAFGENIVDVPAFKRYGISGIVKDTYLSGLSGGTPPQFNMYYEEFGTIMREAAYFDIKYDKAYPALTSQISPVLNSAPGFKVSGYHAGSYGAQFLVFNVMDKAVNLDETSGNYLRIQGVSFTQNTTHELTMDKYYNEAGNMSDPDVTDSGLVLRPPRTAEDTFKTLKINRMKHGKVDWSFDSDYIQDQSSAEELMSWLAKQTTRPRKLIGAEIFPNPMLQLGDIVSIDYSVSGFNKLATEATKFVVYNVEYSRDESGPTMTIYVSEV